MAVYLHRVLYICWQLLFDSQAENTAKNERVGANRLRLLKIANAHSNSQYFE